MPKNAALDDDPAPRSSSDLDPTKPSKIVLPPGDDEEKDEVGDEETIFLRSNDGGGDGDHRDHDEIERDRRRRRARS